MSDRPSATEQQPSARPQGAPSPTGGPAGAPQGSGAPAGGPAIQRQFVNFSFYKLDPAFRRLGDHEKIQARSEFLQVIQKQPQAGMICLT